MLNKNNAGQEGPMTTTTITHETYIAQIRNLATARVADAEASKRLAGAKVVYGSGRGGTRGTTFFKAWQNGSEQAFVEICATGEESDVQIAGTTIHEMAHVLAGWNAGHGKEWREACAVLGLIHAEAGGQSYTVEHFAPEIWAAIEKLALPTDGRPVFKSGQHGSLRIVVKPRPCPMGIGTRGGKSRGTGSGSRLRLWVCKCEQPVKVRVASDDFQATCKKCGSDFERPVAVQATEAA